MWTWKESQPLKHAVNLDGMAPGDFFFFCDHCGYQHKKNYVISGRCPECRPERANMIQCTVTAADVTRWANKEEVI